jgi:hypothetical protein
MVTISFAQGKVVKADLVGSWKPTSVDMGSGAIAYDFTKETLFVSDSVKKTWKSAEDSAMVYSFIDMMFSRIGKMVMTFSADNVYIESIASGREKKGSYTFDENSSLLTTTSTNTQNVIVKRINGQLVFEGDLGDGNKMTLVLKKQ